MPESDDRQRPEEHCAPARPPLEAYRLVVECRDEHEQRALYERLVAAGHKVRVLMW